MALKVGIDFGTSNSGVAVSDGRQVRLLPLDPQNVAPEVIRTILYVTKDFKHYIGQEAVELYYRQNVDRLRRYVKKWVGEIEVYGGDMYFVRDVYTYVDELRPGRLLQFLKTALRSEGYQGTQIFERYYTTADLISAYLGALKQRAEAHLHEKITGVTLGRPVKFYEDPEMDHAAEETLRQAADNAGFKQVELELEPVAAALDYERRLDHPQNALIFDFGGGTLDITIMRLGDPRRRQVYANGGIGLAGSDFDRTIIRKRLLPHFGKGYVEHNPDLLELVIAVSDWIALPELSTPQARAQIEQAVLSSKAPARLKALQSLIFNDLAFSFFSQVEMAKINLSSQGATVIALHERNLDLWELYTRFQFEKDIREYRERIEAVVLETLIASGLEPEQIDVVVKTGGSSSIPSFSDMLAGLFGPDRLYASSTFSSVTTGLALRAASAPVERG
jgi:hypothetical chaperone protein